jgi:hypothetical protein
VIRTMSLLTNRWLIAAVVMASLTAATLLVGTMLKASALEDIRRGFRQGQAEGDPRLQNVDVEGLTWDTLGDTEVSERTMLKIGLGDAAWRTWWLWGPVYLILIFGTAWLWHGR